MKDTDKIQIKPAWLVKENRSYEARIKALESEMESLKQELKLAQEALERERNL